MDISDWNFNGRIAIIFHKPFVFSYLSSPAYDCVLFSRPIAVNLPSSPHVVFLVFIVGAFAGLPRGRGSAGHRCHGWSKQRGESSVGQSVFVVGGK